MSKKKKKRNKAYTGQDAATPIEPTIRRYTAVDRGRFGQWWYEKKKIVKYSATVILVIVLLVWFITEIIRLLS